MSWIAIIIALTGLVWSFEWVNNSVQWVANGGKIVAVNNEKIVSDTTGVTNGKTSVPGVADSLFISFARNLKISKRSGFTSPILPLMRFILPLKQTKV